MSEAEKNDLINALRESYAQLTDLLGEADLEMQAYTDSDWQIKDILGHIATWDREAAKSLTAYLKGEEYLTADLDEDETDFNERDVIEKRQLSADEIRFDWKSAREELIAAVRAIPPDSFPGDLLYSWGDERGSIRLLVEYMIEHEEEHLDEILAAIESS